MSNNSQDRAKRRLVILEGLNDGLSNEKIAVKLGVSPVVVRRDINVMRHRRDAEFNEALKKAEKQVILEKEKISNLSSERFQSITGMTFQEKTFKNMMVFYGPELRKIIRSKDEGEAIRGLPNNVRKALKRNGIIAQGWKTPEITSKARMFLTSPN